MWILADAFMKQDKTWWCVRSEIHEQQNSLHVPRGNTSSAHQNLTTDETAVIFTQKKTMTEQTYVKHNKELHSFLVLVTTHICIYVFLELSVQVAS